MTSHPLLLTTHHWLYVMAHTVYDIICIIYDVTHTVCMTTQGLYPTCNPLKQPSHPLCMSSHPLSQRYHTYCVMHHRWHMNAIKCTIQYIISTLYDNNIWYLWHYMRYIQYITCIIYDNSFTLYDVTFTICGTSHNDSIYDIKPYMFMTYSLYMASHTVLWPHTIVFISWHTLYEIICITYVVTHIVCMTTQALYLAWNPLKLLSHPLCM